MGAKFDQGVTSRAGRLGVLAGIMLLGACTSWHNYSPLRDPPPQTHPTVAEIPMVDWKKARQFRMLMTEFAFSPKEPTFVAGDAYRLILRNAGEETHIITGTNFWRAIAIRNIVLATWMPHGSNGHVDKQVGPKGADLLPVLPKAFELDTIVDKTRADSAKAQAKKAAVVKAAEEAYEAEKKQGGVEAEEADNPFAAPAEDDEGVSADDPFAAKTEDTDEATEAEDPFAADTEDADEAETADDPFAAKPEESDEAETADDPFAAETEDDDSPTPADNASDENTADTEETEDTETADVEDGEENDKADDDDVAAEDGESDEETESADVDEAEDGGEAPDTGWTPIIVDAIEVPPGHEAVIEFVAVRPGVYGFWSEIGPFVAMGMFGEATIEVVTEDEAEVETAAVIPPETEDETEPEATEDETETEATEDADETEVEEDADVTEVAEDADESEDGEEKSE